MTPNLLLRIVFKYSKILTFGQYYEFPYRFSFNPNWCYEFSNLMANLLNSAVLTEKNQNRMSSHQKIHNANHD